MITLDPEKNSSISVLQENMIEADKECIERNEGYQISELKYATFDDIAIDDQLKSDITYEILMNDFKSVSDILFHYRSIYSSLLLENPHNIIYSLKKYGLKFINFNINAFLLQRQLDLMSYVIKIKFEYVDEIYINLENNLNNEISTNEYIEIIKKVYYGKSLDDLIMEWTSDESLKKVIFEEVDDMVEIREIFSKGIESESFILKYVNKNIPTPSICGIGVLLKYLRMILEKAIANIQIMSNSFTEDMMLNFFQDCCKIAFLSMIVKNTFRVPQNDIFNLKESSEEWVNLKKHYERIVKLLIENE